MKKAGRDLFNDENGEELKGGNDFSDPFAVLQPKTLSIDKCYVVRKLQWTDFEELYL